MPAGDVRACIPARAESMQSDGSIRVGQSGGAGRRWRERGTAAMVRAGRPAASAWLGVCGVARN